MVASKETLTHDPCLHDLTCYRRVRCYILLYDLERINSVEILVIRRINGLDKDEDELIYYNIESLFLYSE